jgi:hypothetical protein
LDNAWLAAAVKADDNVQDDATSSIEWLKGDVWTIYQTRNLTPVPFSFVFVVFVFLCVFCHYL